MPARLPPESFPAARPMPGNVTEVVAAWAELGGRRAMSQAARGAMC